MEKALIVIDVQKSFLPLPRWDKRGNPDFEENLANLIAFSRAQGIPIFFVKHSDNDETFRKDSPYYELMDFLDVREEDQIVEKTTISTFLSTNLEEELKRRGIKKLMITGIQTEQCCETSTRHAFDLGFDVEFILDATLTFDLNFKGEVVSADKLMEATAWVLDGRFAKVVNTSDIIST